MASRQMTNITEHLGKKRYDLNVTDVNTELLNASH